MMSSDGKHVLDVYLIWGQFEANISSLFSGDYRGRIGRTRKKITWRINITEMEEEGENNDDNGDILTRFTNFVDNNLRLFRVRIKKECFSSVII